MSSEDSEKTSTKLTDRQSEETGPKNAVGSSEEHESRKDEQSEEHESRKDEQSEQDHIDDDSISHGTFHLVKHDDGVEGDTFSQSIKSYLINQSDIDEQSMELPETHQPEKLTVDKNASVTSVGKNTLKDRFTDDTSEHISGDFIPLTDNKPFGASDPSVDMLMTELKSEEDLEKNEEEMDEEVPEEQIEHEEEHVIIDRNMYYEMYDIFKNEHIKHKITNTYLQAKIASYYARRKMMYVLREPIPTVDVQKKYEKQLEAYENLLEISERENSFIQGEIYHLESKRNAKAATLEASLQKLLQAELDCGKGLTDNKTGKVGMDKIVERFVTRQRKQIMSIARLRLDYIKLRNKTTEKLSQLEALNHLGPGYHIMDYVQLKNDNRDLHDKVEERESQLTRLRQSCRNRMQILAHNREKSSVLDLEIGKLKDRLEDVDGDLDDAREQLSYLRREKDDYRKSIRELKEEFGLLTFPKLLRDMEISVNQLASNTTKLESLQKGFYEKSEFLRVVRKNIEHELQKKMNDEGTDGNESTSSNSSLETNKNGNIKNK